VWHHIRIGNYIIHIGLPYGGRNLFSRGREQLLTDRVCENGCILCVDACTSLIFIISVTILFVYYTCSDTGYQWAPLHVFVG
jgi:hypothetical protein